MNEFEINNRVLLQLIEEWEARLLVLSEFFLTTYEVRNVSILFIKKC